jgi:hypothetical protein
MTQSRAEVDRLMEQQHGFNTSQGNFHEDVEDDEEFLEDCPICDTEESINGSGRCSYCGYRRY